ncbi:MAG: ribosome silencing factor [Rhodovibrionaceae bacterium]|nr:ribosome silencing factor [Rhodovibrionaceae bacterium]
MLRLVATSLEDDKAEDLVVIDLTDKSSIADAMVIASGRSARQVSAMAEHLLERLKAAGLKGVGAEGQARGDWVLIDGGDVIVHIFRPEVRSFYNLEKMWGAPAVTARGADAGAQAAVLN